MLTLREQVPWIELSRLKSRAKENGIGHQVPHLLPLRRVAGRHRHNPRVWRRESVHREHRRLSRSQQSTFLHAMGSQQMVVSTGRYLRSSRRPPVGVVHHLCPKNGSWSCRSKFTLFEYSCKRMLTDALERSVHHEFRSR